MTTVLARLEVPGNVQVESGTFVNLVPRQPDAKTWLKAYDGAVRVVGKKPADEYRSTGNVTIDGDTALVTSTTGQVESEMEGLQYMCSGDGSRYFQLYLDRGPYLQSIKAATNANYQNYRMACSYGTTCMVNGYTNSNLVLAYDNDKYASGFTNVFSTIFGAQPNDVHVEAMYSTSNGFYVSGRNTTSGALLTYNWQPGAAGTPVPTRSPMGFTVPAQIGDDTVYYVSNSDSAGADLPDGGVIYKATGDSVTKVGTPPQYSAATRNDWVNVVVDADGKIFVIDQ